MKFMMTVFTGPTSSGKYFLRFSNPFFGLADILRMGYTDRWASLTPEQGSHSGATPKTVSWTSTLHGVAAHDHSKAESPIRWRSDGSWTLLCRMQG